ncbi:MAG: glycoside hydrolase family 3 C-terminal domain-containing protein [Halieaceae bacterium]|jgi:beta-glucosidase|nr:glycoside hydrolase family 3 C-terminal domain-containing protein [Halieaceae bacterium]
MDYTEGQSPELSPASVEATLAAMTLEEKIAMMSGRGFFETFRADGNVWGASPYRAGGGCERLGIPAFYFTDGPRGVARGESTCFPVTMARGATFDVHLERRIGEAMAMEVRAQGCNLSGAVCINLLRHPGWGRAQETYGEDMHHLGEMGAALSVGLQRHNVAATVKHFAANSIENARFKIDVQMSERVLREVYLPHFKRVIDAGCLTVMSAYNKLNGEYCGQNRHLLTDILRHEWGFEGVVHSDWVMGVYHPYGAAAGLDIENPEPIHFGQKLFDAVTNGQIAPDVIDTACRRILRVLAQITAARDPLTDYPSTLVGRKANTELAYEAALKSAVLLKNDAALLPMNAPSRVVVAGRLARVANIGDGGSSRVRPPYAVSPLEGIEARFGAERVSFGGDESCPDAVAEHAKDADLTVLVVGYTADDEGEYIPGDINLGQEVAEAIGDLDVSAGASVAAETPMPRGGDRLSLRLLPEQVELIHRVASVTDRLLVVIQAGSAVLVREWIDAVPAVLQTFYPGMEGGRALAALIAGDSSPSGRLPFTVARSEADYPFFDRDADTIEYDLWHGYAKLCRDQIQPEFYFGHGLTYSSVAYRTVTCRSTNGGVLEVEVAIENTGSAAVAEVVQLYVSPPGKCAPRWPHYLKGFERCEVAPGDLVFVRFTVPRDALMYWDDAVADWRFETGEYVVAVGPSANPEQHLTTTLFL